MHTSKKKKRKPKAGKPIEEKKGFFAKLFTTLCCCFTVAKQSENHSLPDQHVDQTQEKPVEEPYSTVKWDGISVGEGTAEPTAQFFQKQPSEPREVHPVGSHLRLSPLPSFPGILDRQPVRTCSEPCITGDSAIKAENCKRSDSLRDLCKGERPSLEFLGPVVSSIRASFHQGSSFRLCSDWAGSQCTTMALFAVALSSVLPIFTWGKKELDSILLDGDRAHGNILSSLGRSADADMRVGIYELRRLKRVVMESRFGAFLMEACTKPEIAGILFTNPSEQLDMRDFGMVSFTKALEMALNATSGAVLTMGEYSTAVIRDPMGGFRLWDSHSRDLTGMCHPDGHAVLLKIRSLEDLEALFRLRLGQRKQPSSQFEVMGFRRVE